MTYIIAEPCIDIKDLSCVDVCPVDCIHEFDRILIIDPEECIDCGACEPECPVEAIFPEDALPEKWNDFVKINYRLWRRRRCRQPADERVRDQARRSEPAPRGLDPRVTSLGRWAKGWASASKERGFLMPQQAWSAKRERQYDHIKSSEKKQGRSTKRAKQIAGRDGQQGTRAQGRGEVRLSELDA